MPKPMLESVRAQVPEGRSTTLFPSQVVGPESVKRIQVSLLNCTAVGNPRLKQFRRTKSEKYVFPAAGTL